MRRILLKVSYDGTNYVGWQIQPNGTAIEEVLNKALSKLLKEEIRVIGASRTDSRVHADGNIAVFDTSSRIPGDKFKFALNEFLPDDIVIQDSFEVSADYHPRKVNSIKSYEYRILNRKLPLPKEQNYSYFYYYDLDAEKMDRAAKVLLGEHDFKSFCSIRTQVEDTVRRIYAISVTREGEFIVFRVTGNGFLYNMVRIIVGTLVKIGCGMWPEEKMEEILEARGRAAAGPKAPPQGLTLKSIEEQKGLPKVFTEENPHWGYTLWEGEQEDTTRDAFFTLKHCDEEDYHRTVQRLTKKLSRDGARRILFLDQTGHMKSGMAFDYFTYEEAGADAVFPMEGRWFVTCDLKKEALFEESEEE